MDESGFVLVVGESTAGKSRAAFEAIRARLPDHVFIRPNNRSAIPVMAATALRERRCVVWLDDLEQYVGTDGLTAELVIQLTTGRGRHTVVVATLRAQERARYRTRPVSTTEPAIDDVARVAIRLIDVSTEVRINRRWSSRELERGMQQSLKNLPPIIAVSRSGHSLKWLAFFHDSANFTSTTSTCDRTSGSWGKIYSRRRRHPAAHESS